MRILLVDDTARVRDGIRKILQNMGHAPSEILEAQDGGAALELLKREKMAVDVILADMDMPRVDGIAFLKLLKPLTAIKDIPVIMVTGQAQRQQVAEALRWGARDFIVKPFRPETLKEKLVRLQGPIEARKGEETSILLKKIAEGARTKSETPLLDQIPAVVAEAIRKAASSRVHEAGETILTPGQAADAFSVVLDGEVEVLEGGNPKPSRVLGRGDCFGEVEFLSGSPARDSVRARTRVEVGTVARVRFGELVLQHPELSYAMSGLVARRSQGASAEFSGRLDAMPLEDLAQVLSTGVKTGILHLLKGGEKGGVFFDKGEIRHAWTPKQAGEEAFYELMAWRGADFRFESGGAADKVTITLPAMSLLMEGARRVDEAKRGGTA